MSASIQSKLKEGSVLGGILLLAGSCIGAGMLALPVITGIGGFVPSLFMFLLIWLFMTSTGLLLLEANLALGHDLSLVSIAERTLGKVGKFLAWVLFLFLFYSLSVAYIAASGAIVQSVSADFLGLSIPAWSGSIVFTVVFAIFLCVGTRQVDYLNRLLMAGLIIAYVSLIAIGLNRINPSYLAHRQWQFAWASLPLLVASFGFHNMIPSMAMYFKGDARRLLIVVLVGSFIPLVIYILWEVVMLGIIPIAGRAGLMEALDQGQAATEALRAIVGRSWINTVAQAFALFAIITSFLAQSLSLVDFLGDGLKIPKVRWGRLFLVVLTLAPPFAFAIAYPGIFIRALNLAGGFSAVILFGVMPVMMVWKLRYREQMATIKMVPAGRLLLGVIFAVAVGIFLLELAQELGFSLLPPSVEAQP